MNTETMTYGLCPLRGSECKGEMCAWWDPLERGCAVCAITSSLLQLQGVIDVRVQKDKEPEQDREVRAVVQADKAKDADR